MQSWGEQVHLEDYKIYSERNPSIGKALALSAAPTKIHYLLRGRNAWHSIWVQHYYPGCMATYNHDVESDTEKRRENGSVWSITELPALAISSDAGTLVITQLINAHLWPGIPRKRSLLTPHKGLNSWRALEIVT